MLSKDCSLAAQHAGMMERACVAYRQRNDMLGTFTCGSRVLVWEQSFHVV